MVDWFVLLSPLVVVAVVLLLGFTGCDVVFTIKFPLRLEIRVPSDLSIVESRLKFTEPDDTTQVTVTGLSGTDDGSGTTVLSHLISSPPAGGWKINCGLIVNDGARQAEASADGEFILNGDGSGGTATFDSSGAPATNDFTVVFTGFVPSG